MLICSRFWSSSCREGGRWVEGQWERERVLKQPGKGHRRQWVPGTRSKGRAAEHRVTDTQAAPVRYSVLLAGPSLRGHHFWSRLVLWSRRYLTLSSSTALASLTLNAALDLPLGTHLLRRLWNARGVWTYPPLLASVEPPPFIPVLWPSVCPRVVTSASFLLQRALLWTVG